MINEALIMNKAVGFLKSTSSKILISWLSKSILDAEPDLESVVRKSIKEAISDFQSEFKDVEVFIDDLFLSVLNDIAVATSGNNQLEFAGLLPTLSEKIFNESLLYHPLEETKKIYANSVSDKFCHRLYANLLGSKYANLLHAKEVIAASNFREDTTTKLELIQSSSLNTEELVKAIAEKVGAIETNKNNFLSGAGISDDYPELSDKEDEEIADLFSKIDDMVKAESNYHEQLALAKKILAKVPPSRTTVYQKAYNTLLGCYLRGDEAAWKMGLAEEEKWTGSRSPYSNVILAAINNNLQNWGVALQIISGIPKSDIAAFSEKQKNSYYLIFALIKYHLNDTLGAQQFLEKCGDKDDNEYLHILFYVFSNSKDSDLLARATEILSNDKYNTWAVHSAVYYIINMFSILQSELGNGIDALIELKPHLELAFSRSKKIIENNRSKESFALKYLILALPSLARLVGRAKEALDIIKIGIDRGYGGFFFLHNCAACFLDMDMIEDGIACCEKVSVKETILQEGLDLYLLFLRKGGQENKLQNLLEDIKKLSLPEEKKWKALVATSRVIDGSQFFEVASEGYSKFPNSGWATLYLAESYIIREDYDKAIDLLKKGRDQKEIRLVATVNLAKLLAGKLQRPEDALEYYEEVIKIETPLQEKIEYILCLYDLDLFGEVIVKIDEFDPEAKISKIQSIKAYACTQMGELPTAKTILKRVCSDEKNNYEDHFNYASLCQRLGHNNDLVEALIEVVRIKPDDYGSHLLLSQGLFNQRKFKDAVIHARFALLGDFQNQICHFNFINIHRVAFDALPDDKFVRSTELEDLHRDVLNNFPERFPDSKLIQRFELPTDSEGKPDIGFLRELLEDQNSWRENLLTMYRDQCLPLSFLVNGIKRDIYEVWSFLLGTGDQFGLIVNRMEAKTLQRDVLKIKQSKAIILDGFSLICLQSAGVLAYLSKLEKMIIVGSKTAQEFIQIRHRLNSSNGGHLSVGLQDGKMVKELITETQVASAIGFIEDISSFIANKGTVLTSNKIERKADNDIRNILDESYKELWDLNGTDQSVSVWADGNLGCYSNSVGKHVSTLQALLLCMVDAKALSRE